MKHASKALSICMICGALILALSGCDRSREAWDGVKQRVEGLAG